MYWHANMGRKCNCELPGRQPTPHAEHTSHSGRCRALGNPRVFWTVYLREIDYFPQWIAKLNKRTKGSYQLAEALAIEASINLSTLETEESFSQASRECRTVTSGRYTSSEVASMNSISQEETPFWRLSRMQSNIPRS
ncbi:hypothetical protein BU16DRAFT_85615 [Lophium mytilinum]|uniref:Uncharacterized protein n=1 Tax=Lophium mytilinum TaxID=390894 RepID=A0A6A6QKK0_9PEZI|nr:hypothetical protein BU16DRAFT_85615 [Lophium mytilinum]